ncbi:MAG: STAS domain-containing protein [Rubrivivax sp.]
MATAPLRLTEAATMRTVAAQVAGLDAALAAASGTLVIDASALAELDTSAVALLLHAQRGARARGLALQVTGAPPKLRALAQLYGVSGLLPLDGSAGDAT